MARQKGLENQAERAEERRIREQESVGQLGLGRQQFGLAQQLAGKQFGVGTEGFGLAGLAPQLAREVSQKQFGVGGQDFGLAGLDPQLNREIAQKQFGVGGQDFGLEGRKVGLAEAMGQQQFGVQGPGFAPAQPQGGFGQTLGFGQPSGTRRGLSRFGLEGEKLRETAEQRKFGQELQRQTQLEQFLLGAKAEYEKNPPWRQTGKTIKDPRTGKEKPEEVLQPFAEYVEEILSGAGQKRQEKKKRESFRDRWD